MSDRFSNFAAAARERERRLANPSAPGAAQAAYLMPSFDAFYGSLRERAGPGGYRLSGAGTSLGGDPSGSTQRPGDEDTARTLAINGYLGQLADDNKGRAQADREIAARNQALTQAEQDRQSVTRAAAIANTPGASAGGAPIVGGDGSYATGDAPPGDPRQIAAQMAPGLIAPPGPAAPVTFGKPEAYKVGGKSVVAQQGSDGRLYGMDRKPIDPASLELGGGKKADYTLDGVRYSGETNKAIAGTTTAKPGKPATPAERNVLAFHNRAKQAEETLSGLEDAIKSKGLVGQAQLQFAPNWLQSEENQAYRQAQRAFTEARLRKESGAAIPPEEFASDEKTYFAQSGDSAAVLEQKRKGRARVLDGLAFSSGRAYDEYYGEPRAGAGGGAVAPPPAGLPDIAEGTRMPIPGGGFAEMRGWKMIRVE